MVEITRIENADALEDRAILDCIQALAAEERRLRTAAAASTDADTERLAEIGTNLEELWALLRARRAAREAGDVPASLVEA